MQNMFRESIFNQPIGSWDVSNVTSMDGMFQESQFNQPINMWCVSNIATEPEDFSTGSPLLPEYQPLWGTCPVTSTEPEEHPTDFNLSQNYPNPFNPTTNIGFSLTQPTHVRLEVFSVSGQLVAVLMNETMSSGYHTVIFDAEHLSSGLYLYRLTTPEFTQTRVMNFIK